ncbi:MAG: histidine triad family protein, partial [Bradyrhizobium sp.]
DITEEDYLHVARATRKLARVAMTAFEADGITVQQFNESAGGQVVFHLHVHIMPRHDGIALLPPASRMEDKAVLEAHAAKLIAALGG